MVSLLVHASASTVLVVSGVRSGRPDMVVVGAVLAGIGTMTLARWCASKHRYPDAHAAGHGGPWRTPGASQQCVEALAPRGVVIPHEVLPLGGLRAPAVMSWRSTAALPRRLQMGISPAAECLLA